MLTTVFTCNRSTPPATAGSSVHYGDWKHGLGQRLLSLYLGSATWAQWKTEGKYGNVGILEIGGGRTARDLEGKERRSYWAREGRKGIEPGCLGVIEATGCGKRWRRRSSCTSHLCTVIGNARIVATSGSCQRIWMQNKWKTFHIILGFSSW